TEQLIDLTDRIRWELVLPVIVAMLGAGRASVLLQDVTGRLAALDLADDGADPLRDRPARPRLDRVVDAAAEWARDADPDRDREPLAGAGRALAGLPDMAMPAARLLLAATRFDGQLTDRLSEICALLAGQPVAATHLAASLTRRVATSSDADPEVVRAVAASLCRDGGLAASLFAVALTGYGRRLGWPAQWRAQLREVRRTLAGRSWLNGFPSRLKLHDTAGVMRMYRPGPNWPSRSRSSALP